MNKIEELYDLKVKLEQTRKHFINLNNKYNEYLDKQHSKTNTETFIEFLKSKDIDSSSQEKYPFLIKLLEKLFYVRTNYAKKHENEINEFTRRREIYNTDKYIGEIRDKYAIKKLILLLVCSLVIIFNGFVFNNYIPLNIANYIFSGNAIVLIIGYNFLQDKQFKKINTYLNKYFQENKEEKETIDINKVYYELCETREYFHKLESEFDKLLGYLNTDEYKLYEEYVKELNLNEESTLEFEDDELKRILSVRG